MKEARNLGSVREKVDKEYLAPICQEPQRGMNVRLGRGKGSCPQNASGQSNSIRVMVEKTMEKEEKTDIRCASSINRHLFASHRNPPHERKVFGVPPQLRFNK